MRLLGLFKHAALDSMFPYMRRRPYGVLPGPLLRSICALVCTRCREPASNILQGALYARLRRLRLAPFFNNCMTTTSMQKMTWCPTCSQDQGRADNGSTAYPAPPWENRDRGLGFPYAGIIPGMRVIVGMSSYEGYSQRFCQPSPSHSPHCTFLETRLAQIPVIEPRFDSRIHW
jgi:hypothetical protein